MKRFLIVLLLAGCANTQPVYSCPTSGGGSCIDYVAGYTLAGASAACSGALNDSACPSAGRVASCELMSPDGQAFVQRYYPPTTVESAQAICGSTAASLPAGWTFSFTVR